jgi:hypothetical protein
MPELRTTEPNAVYISADLAKTRDFTAISVLERVAPDRLECGYLSRFQPTRYQDVVSVLERMVAHERRPVQVMTDEPVPTTYVARAPVTVVVDRTGVGEAVSDLIEAAHLDCDLRFIVIHGGNVVSRVGHTASVPKRDLMAALSVALENQRLVIAAGLPLTATLLDELKGIRIKLSDSGRDRYEAGDDWRSSPHDDLALSLAMAVWVAGESDRGGSFEAIPFEMIEELARWGIG